MNITAIGIDLAKNVLQLHGVDQRGKGILRKQLRRAQSLSFFVNLPPCLVGMEACGGAHFWTRKLTAMGHTVKLMAPQFVKRYVKTNKNDAADAEAICEAVTRPNMRFVPIKSGEQQADLGIHRARKSFAVARTAQSNQIQGLLAEFGFAIPQGTGIFVKRLPSIDKGLHTFHVLNLHDDGVSLDDFVQWIIDAVHRVQRVENYQTWLNQFDTALRALPDKDRQQSFLPLLHELRTPMAAIAGSLVGATLFRAAVRIQGIGTNKDIPHLDCALINKFLSDLRLLRLI